MNFLIGAVIGGLILVLVERRHQTITATISASPQIAPLPPRVVPPNIVPPQMMIGSTAVDGALLGAGVGIGEQVGESFADAGSNLAKAIPIVGTIVGAIASSLLAAHEQRKRQATDENSAVAGAVAHVDLVISTAFNNANARKISAADAAYLLDQGYAQYWSIIGAHIQPGRNGCQNGAGIPDYPGGGIGSVTANAYFGCPGNSTTKSDWGAACCIGSSMKASISNAKWALAHPGQPAPIIKLFSSKYGFPGRASYNVTYQP